MTYFFPLFSLYLCGLVLLYGYRFRQAQLERDRAVAVCNHYIDQSSSLRQHLVVAHRRASYFLSRLRRTRREADALRSQLRFYQFGPSWVGLPPTRTRQ